jgi:uncharacterized repeat protein (TIGR01451 family)
MMAVDSRLVIVCFAVLTAAAGCSYNPGYFPHLLPGGPIIPHHAKPLGWGYFHNYDPQAYKVEITPGDQIQAPVGTAVVLVGTVFDKDGQPRRSRRIEWLVEGTGMIVEADESGIYPGRGYKVNNQYAITYTNYRTHTITRGNDDPADDVVIAPGQTFCVVSSSVPGETVVTAYAPEVFSWSRSRAVVRILWGEGRIQFPPSAVVRWGGEWTLTTQIQPTNQSDSQRIYRVRYRLLEGPTAQLIIRSGSSTGASQSGVGGREAEVFTDAEGRAAVRLVQLQPQPGKSRIAVEIIQAPAPGSDGQEKVIAQRETVVEWAAPDLGLSVQSPATAAVQAPFPTTVIVDNRGLVESQPLQLRLRLADGLSLVRSDPPPLRIDTDSTLLFELPAVPPRGQQHLRIELRGEQPGPAQLDVAVRSADGLQASQRKSITLDTGRLQAVVEAPPLILLGETSTIRVAATNVGSAPIDNALAWLDYDSGLVHTNPAQPLELPIGRIEAGQTRIVEAPLQARQVGRWSVRAVVTADGQISATAAPVSVEIRKAQLTVGIHLPPLIYKRQECVATVTVSNRGDIAAQRALLRLLVPPELRVVGAEQGGRIGPTGVEWHLPELAPGAQRTIGVRLRAEQLSERATVSAQLLADVAVTARPGADPLVARSEATLSIIGVSAIVLELSAPTGVTTIGQQLSYQIRVRNNGSLAARDVLTRLHLSEHFRFIRGTAPSGAASPEGGGFVVFPLLSELKPGETAIYQLVAEAIQAGQGRVRAEVRAQHLQRALVEEQTAAIIPSR